MLKMRLGAVPDTDVNTPQCSVREVSAPTQADIGALILPQREDGEVIRPDVGRSRQTVCNEATRVIHRHEVEASIRADIHTGEGLVIQREWERYRDWRIAVVAVIARISVTRHDRIGAIGYGVLARRTTSYGITALEVRVRIAIRIVDRPGGDLCVQAPPKGIFSVNSVVMFPLVTVTAVTVAPVLPPLRCRSVIWTEVGSTALFQFTSYV